MRILLDQAVHDHRNQGNNALLGIALERFRKFWPDATFEIISHAPHLCKVYFPNTTPVFPETLNSHKSRIDVFHSIIPRSLWRLTFDLREIPFVQKTIQVIKKLKASANQDKAAPENGTKKAMQVETDLTENKDNENYQNMAHYDLYVPTGAGYMCDSDKRFLLKVFDRLEKAVDLGIPAVMVGQGIGPLEDQDLIKRGREVLPRIDYIMIREERVALPILDRLGVPREKVFMTGDDAIELAYQARVEKLGSGIGVSLRVAHYTKVNDENIKSLKPIVLQKAKKYNAKLIAVPIDINDADKKYVEEIMSGYSRSSSNWRKFDTYYDLIKRTRKCRIMISGTFHAAVFAVSQGIPVIALANSAEYQNKALGLTAEFGEEGCRVINLSDPNFEDYFSEAIELAWASAEQLRPRILEDAKRQIDLGYAAYQKIFSMVEARKSR